MELRVRYVLVGLFALLVGLAAISFALWIQNKGTLGRRSELIVRFEGPAPGLRAGAPVTFNGVRVGEVTRLSFDPSRLSSVDAHLALDTSVPVTAGTKASLESQGLLGSVYISLAGGDASKPLQLGQGPSVLTADPVKSLSQEAHDALQGINSVVADNSAPLHDVVTNIQAFSKVLARNGDRIEAILQGLERTLAGPDKQAKPPMFDLPAPKVVDGFDPVPDESLVVNDPTGLVAYDTQRLLVESAEGQISPQPVEWPDSIPKLVQKRVLQALDNAGYHLASSPQDNASADLQLAIEIRSFQVVQGAPSVARIALGARLLSSDGKVLDSHVAVGSADVKANDLQGEVTGMREAFTASLEALLLWFKDAAKSKP